VVPGGPDAGEALVRHPGISKISFTGGVETAKAIQAAAASSLTPLLLELGGKSANIVFADSDLETAASVAVSGLAALNGQTCIAPTRLLVERRRYDEVLDAVRAGVGALRLGDPFAADTVMGPIISERAVDRILGVIDGARAEGAGRLIAGGARLEQGMGGGFFVEPTVFADVDNASSLAQSEIFGPVLSVMPFADEAEAVALANATTYGLSAYVQTTDLERAHRVAHALDAGTVWVNAPGNPIPAAPFGGFKASGYGKQGGRLGVEEFTRVKNVNISIRPLTKVAPS
jgi:aldehyde dehydrogenase (NAD+)